MLYKLRHSNLRWLLIEYQQKELRQHMKVSIQKPRNFINPLLSRKAVDAEKFNAFK